jgi:hypothetical protein
MALGVVVPVAKDGSNAHTLGRLISIESIASRPGNGQIECTGATALDFSMTQVVAMQCVRARVNRWVHVSDQRLACAQPQLGSHIKDDIHAFASTYHLQVVSHNRWWGNVCTVFVVSHIRCAVCGRAMCTQDSIPRRQPGDLRLDAEDDTYAHRTRRHPAQVRLLRWVYHRFSVHPLWTI